MTHFGGPILRRFLGATRAHSFSYVTEEQRRNRPIADLPEGPGRFGTPSDDHPSGEPHSGSPYAAPSSFVAYIVATMRAPHFSFRCKITLGEVCHLFFNEP